MSSRLWAQRLELSGTNGRQQLISHIQSSLDQPDLESVQAKLLAIRQRNHSFGQQYFREKYGSAEAYNRFLHSNGIATDEQIVPPAEDFRRKLEREAEIIREQQLVKIRSRQSANTRNDNHSGTNSNPWLETEQQKGAYRPKDKTYSAKNQLNQLVGQSLVPGVKVETIKQLKSTSKQKVHTALNKTMGPTNQMIKSILKVPEITSKQERELAEKIIKQALQLRGPENVQKSMVPKSVLVAYLVRNSRIRNILGLSQQNVHTTVDEFKSIDALCLTFSECINFIRKLFGKDQIRKQSKSESFPKGCLLGKDIYKRFQKYFDDLDLNKDLIVLRHAFIGRIATDPVIKKQLNAPAVQQGTIGRSVCLRRVLQRIEMECLLGSVQQQKAAEYISWEQFLKYFEPGNKKRENYSLTLLLESLRDDDKFGLSKLPQDVACILRDAFISTDNLEEYLQVKKLTAAITNHSEYETEQYSQVRPDCNQTNLEAQSLAEVIRRIEASAPLYLTGKQFIEYFSEKGIPLDKRQVDIGQVERGSQSAQFIREHATSYQGGINDLNEGHQDTDGINHESKYRRKTIEERPVFVFKAKPVPWYCTVNLLDKKKESEDQRFEKIVKYAQESLSKAKLPPRMEKDFQQRIAKAEEQKHRQIQRPQSCQPQRRVKEPPNFLELHQKLEIALERKRKQHKSTQVQEFKFTEPAQRPAKIEKAPSPPKIEHKTKISQSQSQIGQMAKTTMKFAQQVEKRREEEQKKRLVEDKKLKEDQERKKVDPQLRKKIVQAVKAVQINRQPQSDIAAENKKQQQQFTAWKKQRIEKARQRPSLMDEPLKKDERAIKAQKLLKMSKTMKQNGINGKQHDKFFSRQQLLLIRDYEALQQGMKK